MKACSLRKESTSTEVFLWLEIINQKLGVQFHHLLRSIASPFRGARGVLITLLLTVSLHTHAQETVYTLNQYTPLMYNPAVSSIDHEAGLSFFHDELTVGSGDFITSNIFNAEYPFIQKATGQRYLGIGVNFSERNFGQSELLKTYNAGLSVSSNVRIADGHSISLGLAGNYYNKRTSMENISTGSQWIEEEFRYDPNGDPGEYFEHSSIQYFSMGTGLIWQWMEAGQQKAFVGLSAFHLNKPSEAFFQEKTQVPVTYNANAGAVIYHSRSLAFTPQIYYTSANQANTYRAIWSTKFLFANNNPYDIIRSGNLDLLINYAFSKDASIGLILNQPGFSCGFSYNFPVNGREGAYLQNGFQVGVSISRLLWKRKPKKVVIESVPQRRQFDFGEKQTIVKQESEVDIIKDKLEELDKVKSLQFELSKDFKFAFGEAKLSKEAEPFLRELKDMLIENHDYQLLIIGHTDNTGSKQVNYELSIERAQVVADYLVQQGVDPEQITVRGKGDTDPIAPNETEEDKAKNRRVEFLISVDR